MRALCTAISPCPNDTFLFNAWHQGRVDAPFKLDLRFADIQQLNTLALQGGPELCKMSFPALKATQGTYRLLSVGCALGDGVGPLVVSREPFALEELSEKKVAIPGELTTAHLLLQRLAPPPREKLFCLYHESIDLLTEGLCDAAVIIHEQRFTYQHHGLVLVADLGEKWKERTTLPIPLGCLALHKSVGEFQPAITRALQQSLEIAWERPDETLPFVLSHSHEVDPLTVKQHIELYVTDETYALSLRGRKAIEVLLCDA